MDQTSNDCEVCETCSKIKNLLAVRDRAIKLINDSTIISILQLNEEYNRSDRPNTNEKPMNLASSTQKGS